MESKQQNTTSVETLLNRINKWYQRTTKDKVNKLRFEIGEDINLYCFKVQSAIERILKTSQYCGNELTETELEKIKKLIK